MSSHSNYAALDVGNRRIGVAIASYVAKIPSPFTTIDRTVEEDVYACIQRFVRDNNIGVLVIGLPRDIKSNRTSQTNLTHKFIRELKASGVGIPVLTQDEAVSSIVAEDRLKQRKKNYTKADIDAEAACVILQDYLDATQKKVS